MVGVHADPLPGPALVRDELVWPVSVEEGQKLGDRLRPPRERGYRGMPPDGSIPVVVAVAVVLHAGAPPSQHAARV